MLLALLEKDLRRAWRNPVRFAINLALPLCITALIGLAFGRSSSSGGLGRISVAIVDEDQSPLTDFLKSGLSQAQAGKHLDARFLERDQALEAIADNQLSAVWIIPAEFTSDYLRGDNTVTLELIKNPAQTYYPAITEEILRLLVTGLNAVGRGLRSELPAWRELAEREDTELRDIFRLVERTGERLEKAREYLNPPLIQYTKEIEAAPESEPSQDEGADEGFSLFAYLLAGLGAMFMLFVADQAVRDLYREIDGHTLERFHTLREGLGVFVAAKAVFVLVMLLLVGLVIFVGGGWMFRFAWRQPVEMLVLTAAYACFAAGLMAVLAALAGNERRADLFNAMIAMALGLAGGCLFPTHQLPAFLREGISPWLPTYWFAETVRGLQFDWDGPAWGWAALKLTVLGLLGLTVASTLFHRRFAKGVRA